MTPAPVGTPGSTPTPGKRTPGAETRGVSWGLTGDVTGTQDPHSHLPNPCHPWHPHPWGLAGTTLCQLPAPPAARKGFAPGLELPVEPTRSLQGTRHSRGVPLVTAKPQPGLGSAFCPADARWPGARQGSRALQGSRQSCGLGIVWVGFLGFEFPFGLGFFFPSYKCLSLKLEHFQTWKRHS